MSKPTQHPTFATWVEYVRLGQRALEVTAASHLERCPECRATVDSLADFSSFARQDGEYEPPDSVMAEAMAVFRGKGVAVRVPVDALIAQVVYDSRAEGARAGTRAASRPTHLLYRADRFCVDVQLTREHLSNQVLAIGQIVDQLDKEHQIARAPLTVTSVEHTLARTQTNEWGEFQVEYVPHGDLRLNIVVDDSRAFVIPLPRLSEMEKP